MIVNIELQHFNKFSLSYNAVIHAVYAFYYCRCIVANLSKNYFTSLKVSTTALALKNARHIFVLKNLIITVICCAEPLRSYLLADFIWRCINKHIFLYYYYYNFKCPCLAVCWQQQAYKAGLGCLDWLISYKI